MPHKGTSKSSEREGLLCPSAYPEMAGSRVLATVEEAEGQPHRPHVTYLPVLLPVPPEMRAAPGEPRPTKAFRFVAPCVEAQCTNWSGTRCQVAQHMVQKFPPVVGELPACQVRAECRWFAEEGGAACVRCPQVITDDEKLIAAINQKESPAPARAPLGEALSADVSRSAIEAVARSFKPA